MKFGKITSKNVSQDALALGGALGGGALSGGIVTLVPEEQKTMARGGITALSLVGASSLKGTTSTEKLVKFLMIGMAIRQGSELIKEFAGKEIQLTEESSTSQKFVGGMVGLACPCEEQNNGALRAAPVINFEDLPGRAPVRKIPEYNSGLQASGFAKAY